MTRGLSAFYLIVCPFVHATNSAFYLIWSGRVGGLELIAGTARHNNLNRCGDVTRAPSLMLTVTTMGL